MKKIFLWIFISHSIFSCSNKATEPEIENYIPHKNVMTGFGKIKIGMSVQDFETNNDGLYTAATNILMEVPIYFYMIGIS